MSSVFVPVCTIAIYAYVYACVPVCRCISICSLLDCEGITPHTAPHTMPILQRCAACLVVLLSPLLRHFRGEHVASWPSYLSRDDPFVQCAGQRLRGTCSMKPFSSSFPSPGVPSLTSSWKEPSFCSGRTGSLQRLKSSDLVRSHAPVQSFYHDILEGTPDSWKRTLHRPLI